MAHLQGPFEKPIWLGFKIAERNPGMVEERDFLNPDYRLLGWSSMDYMLEHQIPVRAVITKEVTAHYRRRPVEWLWNGFIKEAGSGTRQMAFCCHEECTPNEDDIMVLREFPHSVTFYIQRVAVYERRRLTLEYTLIIEGKIRLHREHVVLRLIGGAQPSRI